MNLTRRTGHQTARILSFVIIIGTLSTSPARTSSGELLSSFWNIVYTNFDFLPEYHFDADLTRFLFHKSDFFKTHYFLENTTNFEFALIGFRKTVYSIWLFNLQNGMGQTPGNIVFDPMDINYGILPTIELRFDRFIVQSGVDHHCFHEVDRKDFATVYYNRLYAGVGSKNMRLYDYWLNLVSDSSTNWTTSDRLSWYVATGIYPRSFFGIVRPSKINGGNPNRFDATATLRYAFHSRRSWIFDLYGKSNVGYYSFPQAVDPTTDDGYFWRQDCGVECNFRRGKKGGMIFFTYTFDDLPLYQKLPRFSRDKLFQIGLRFYQ